MSGYIGQIPTPQATQTRQTFTATASQTSFATGGYQAGYLDVFLNGVKLVDGTDYTATNGSDVVLTTGAASGDTLEVVAYTAFEVLNQNFTGGVTVDNDAATVLTVDRATSDGTIIDVQKDGSTVGSIGAYAGDMVTGTGDVGIRWEDAGDLLTPWNPSTNLPRASAIDLGATSVPFKDLYLSGGVYLGGTGSANKLDDYEEGTWTPVPSSGSFSSYNCNYTKIGSLVRITIDVVIGAGGGSIIYGLPFTPADTTGFTPYFSSQDLPSGCLGMGWAIGSGATNIYVRSYRDNASFVPTGLTGGAQIHVDFTYRTTA